MHTGVHRKIGFTNKARLNCMVYINYNQERREVKFIALQSLSVVTKTVNYPSGVLSMGSYLVVSV